MEMPDAEAEAAASLSELSASSDVEAEAEASSPMIRRSTNALAMTRPGPPKRKANEAFPSHASNRIEATGNKIGRAVPDAPYFLFA